MLRGGDVSSSAEEEDVGDVVSYYSQDFDWEELRREIESQCNSEKSILNSNSSEKFFSVGSQQTAWEKFHTQHSHGKFFKGRRYLLKEFPELADPDRNFTLLEIGCGTGSSIIPILSSTRNARIFACDLSEAALNLTELQNRIAATEPPSDQTNSRLRTFICDPSTETLPSWLACPLCRASGFSNNLSASCCERGVDLITLIFTLSALQMRKMEELVRECYAVLRPGGLVLFRDYGLYDMTMLRFPIEQKVSDRCYRRQDGTLAYFFSCEVLRRLFLSAGFAEVELQYCCIKLFNRKKRLPMKRVWIHAKFMKK